MLKPILHVMAAMTALGLAPGAQAEILRTCAPDEKAADYSPNSIEIDAHRQFQLQRVVYPADKTPPLNEWGYRWGFRVFLIVGADGKPSCVQAETLKALSTPQRKAFLDDVANWRYQPFVREGQAVPIAVSEDIFEEQAPAKHIPMPDGPVGDAVITLSREGCFSTCPAYSVKVNGRGDVVFDGQTYVVLPGKHAYTVPAEDVARLIQAARDLDIWSMKDRYTQSRLIASQYDLSITIGGRAKTIVDDGGGNIGMPKAVTDFQDLIDKTAQTGDWTDLHVKTIERLKAEGFDFRTQAGADMLATAYRYVFQIDEPAILALIKEGVPLWGGFIYEPQPENREQANPLPVALQEGHDTIVDALMARDALLTDGKPDQAHIDAAFQAAVSNGRMRNVSLLWAWHPSLTYQSKLPLPSLDDGTVPTKTAPVTLLLYPRDEAAARESLETAKFLLGQGCDINASDGNGWTMLHNAAMSGSVAFVQYLIDHGAKVNARGDLGRTPLDGAFDDDVAIALLEAGADPNSRPEVEDTFAEEAQKHRREKVLTWLRAHGVMVPLPNPDGEYRSYPPDRGGPPSLRPPAARE